MFITFITRILHHVYLLDDIYHTKSTFNYQYYIIYCLIGMLDMYQEMGQIQWTKDVGHPYGHK